LINFLNTRIHDTYFEDQNEKDISILLDRDLLDKEGFQKCPEFKVGMPYEDEPGYYEREDYDSNQRK
jgi:hypothetical protein